MRKLTASLALIAAFLVFASPPAGAQVCPNTTTTSGGAYRAQRGANYENLAAVCDEMFVGELTLAGNPAMAASGIGIGTTGILFEGLTANTIEGLLTAADVSASDKTWTLPNSSGTIALVGDDGVGDMVSPASATDNAVCRFDTTTGKLVQNSVVLVSDLGAVAGSATLAGNPAFLTTEYGFGTTGMIFEGSTADAIETLLIAADPASSDKTVTIPAATGTIALTDNPTALNVQGVFSNTAQALAIADSGNGSAAAGTLTPTTSYVECTCSDADGCNITMSESGAIAGAMVNVVNVGSNACVFADTSGVSELAGAFTAGAADSLTLRYSSTASAWVETARSNN